VKVVEDRAGQVRRGETVGSAALRETSDGNGAAEFSDGGGSRL